MKKLMFMACLALCGMAASTATIAAAQDHAQIKNAADAFVKQQSASLPGKVTYQLGDIDRRIALPACTRLEAFLPPGSQLIGKTSIGVRCTAKNGWSIFVPVQVKVSLSLLISTRQLPMGHILEAQDVATQTMDVSQTEGITDPKQALGKVLVYSIGAGQVLRENMLRKPFSVKQGQIVPLAIQGDGFNIRSEGAALGNASDGQIVRIRIGSALVSGIARANGSVEISP
ncbi:MAG: flagellar basal body P-ring formation chaperone FlgA [Gallionella sp.]